MQPLTALDCGAFSAVVPSVSPVANFADDGAILSRDRTCVGDFAERREESES